MEKVNILCMKWGKKYPADYVNRLHSMVARNLSIPHRFICFTDDSEGFDTSIETFPIPTLPVDISNTPERCWTKILTFSENLYDIQGKCLYLDLDIIILDSIDEMFTVEGDVIIIRDWSKQDGTGNSSVYRFEAGSHPEVLREFVERWPQVMKDHRNEQEYVSSVLLREGALTYWPEKWCRSFKRHCCHSLPKSLFVMPQIPTGAKIIVFHGRPNPHEAIRGESGFWYRSVRPTTWINDYWK